MNAARRLASAGGIGFAPAAPGTVASAAALLPASLLLHAGRFWLLAATGACALAGLWSCRRSGAAAEDPGWIVIDEVCGQSLAVAGLDRPGAAGLALAFVLFRLFDIAKPWPISAIDRRRDAAGIMGDDIAAGAATALVLLALRRILAP
jgi:phosphatidylglycerophosphatase A